MVRFIWILFFFAIPIVAQQPQFEPLNKINGLSNNSVLCILKDSKGFMWFGTYDGLNKYDGSNFTVYKHNPSQKGSISNNRIQAIFEDSKQNIWIGTTNGLNLYNPKKDEFTVYLYDDTIANSISHQNIKAIHEDENGFIWIGTIGGGLNRYDYQTDTFKRYQFKEGDPNSINQDYILSLSQTKKGYLWIGLAGRGIDLFDIKNEKFYHLKYEQQDEDKNFRNNVIRDLYPLKKEKLLVSTYGGFNVLHLNDVKIQEADTLTNKINIAFEHYEHLPENQSSQLANSSVHSTIVDARGNYWMATYGGGLNWHDPKTKEFGNYTTFKFKGADQSMSSIFDLFYDQEQGLLWVAEGSSGVIKIDLNPKSFKNWGTDNNQINAFIESEHFYWEGTYDNGLRRRNKNTGEVLWIKADNKSKGLSSNYITDLELDTKGNLWISTEHQGINLLLKQDFEKPHFIHFKYIKNDSTSLKNNAVVDLEMLSDSVLLAVSAYGMSFINTLTHKVTPWIPSMSDSHDLGRAILRKGLLLSNGELLIGGQESLYSLKKKQGYSTKFDIKAFTYDFKDTTSISDNIINDIVEDKLGRIWVGTNRGLNQYLLKEGTFIRYPYVFEGRIMSLLSDSNGGLWLGTQSGIIRFHPDTGVHNLFEVQKEGYILETFYNAKGKLEDGQLGFGMGNGFVSFYPDKIDIDTTVPVVHFTNLQIFGQNYSIKKDSGDIKKDRTYLQQHINYVEQLKLNHEDKLFKVHFTALDYRNPRKIQYRYRLLGWDDQWVMAGKKGEAQFTNLSPGTYTLQVLSSNVDGVWSQNPKEMAITIIPPWWMTWWFKSLLLIFCLLLLSIPIYLRIQKLKKDRLTQKRIIDVIANTQESERQRISRDLHDSVGGHLVGVKRQLSDLSKKVPQLEESISLLDETYDEVRRIAHNITPGTLMKFGLTAGIESLASTAQSKETKINTYFHEMDGQFDKVFETNVFRMVQELLQNALKHAKPSNINISLTKRAKELNIIIEDDGQGFDTRKTSKNSGNGLKNVGYRVDNFMGKLFIDSSPGGGTHITIELPIP